MRMMNRSKYLLLLILMQPVCVVAEVILDGSMGTDGSINGPDYQVPDSVGKQSGHNLFHSFHTFNIDQGERATFTGQADIQNVISRVTGGNSSSIDGTIDSSAMPNANFFLLNPAGILFGANASLDIGGSFTATTADYVQLDDGTKFHAKTLTGAVLSTASVHTFGFSDADVGDIQINGAQLIANTGKAINLIGGNIDIDQGALVQAENGPINIVSAKSVGTVIMEADQIGDKNFLTEAGSIVIENSIIKNRDYGGNISIYADTLELNNASIKTENKDVNDAGDIEVKVSGSMWLKNGGNISTKTVDSGNAGTIIVDATSINLTEGGQINSNTYSTGNAGQIEVKANSLKIDGGGDALFTGIFSDALSSAEETGGAAGTLFIEAKDYLDISRGGVINSDTYTSGTAGYINIVSDNMNLTEGGQINSNTYSTGNAGQIEVKANSLKIDKAEVSTSTYSTGDAGDVIIQTGGMQLSAHARVASLSAEEATGEAGNININASQNILIDNAVIDISTTQSIGDTAPQIAIKAKNLTLKNAGQITTLAGTQAEAGDILLETKEKVHLLYGSKIITAAHLGDGGDITIKTRDYVYLNDSQIKTSVSTTEGSARGGNIWIDPHFVVLNDSTILAETYNGAGGDITIITDFFMQSGASRISAAANGALGINGMIDLRGPNVTQASGVDQLPVDLLNAAQWAAPSCSSKAGRLSSFVIQQALPMGYGHLLAATLPVPYRNDPRHKYFALDAVSSPHAQVSQSLLSCAL